MSHDRHQQTDTSQGPSQHVVRMNISAGLVDNNMDLRNARLEQSFAAGGSSHHFPGFKYRRVSIPEQQPDVNRAYDYYPATGGGGYGNTSNGAFSSAANISNDYQLNGAGYWPQNGPYNADEHRQSPMMNPAYFQQDRYIPSMQPHLHTDAYLPAGYGRGYDQQYSHDEAPSLLPQANNLQCGQKLASQYFSPPAHQGQASTQPSYVANSAPVQPNFTSRTQARAYQLNRKFDWQCPKGDKTIPQDDFHREAYVLQLKAAMLEISRTGDHTKTFDKRWKNPLASGKPFYEVEHVEIVCRDLIDIAEMLHSEGPATLPIFDKEALKTAAQSKKLTFKLVLDSKTLCDALMKGEKHATFVACTHQMWKHIGNNRKANKNKKELLKIGYEQRYKAKIANAIEAEDKHGQSDDEDVLEKQDHLADAPAAAAVHSTLGTSHITSPQRIAESRNSRPTQTSSDTQQEVSDHDAGSLSDGPTENPARFPSGDSSDAWPNKPGHTGLHLVPRQDDDFLPSDAGTDYDASSRATFTAVHSASGLHGSPGQHAETTTIPPLPAQSRKRSVDTALLGDGDVQPAKRAK
jgi:hypothetical protein